MSSGAGPPMEEDERDRVRGVLRERARALARPMAAPPAEDALELLSFMLRGESCALESRFVHAVFRLGELTPLPGARAPVAGVTGWRGGVLTLFDVGTLLGHGGGGAEAPRHVLVLGRQRPVCGLLAGEPGAVLTLERQRLLPPRESPARAGEIVRGVTADGVVVLDAERLLALADGSKST